MRMRSGGSRARDGAAGGDLPSRRSRVAGASRPALPPPPVANTSSFGPRARTQCGLGPLPDLDGAGGERERANSDWGCGGAHGGQRACMILGNTRQTPTLAKHRVSHSFSAVYPSSSPALRRSMRVTCMGTVCFANEVHVCLNFLARFLASVEVVPIGFGVVTRIGVFIVSIEARESLGAH